MSKDSSAPAMNFDKCTVVLVDIAGTTTSDSFIKDTLLPYVTEHAEEFLKDQWENEAVKAAVKLLKDDTLDINGAFSLLKELTEKNDSNEGLKTLQGLICKKGYESGDLKGHVFSDVPSALESWSKARKVAVYSTGSVESQKQLFSHTEQGDLSKHISKYFDQATGSKIESASYEKIAKDMEVKAEEVLFITDAIDEGKAAKTAGMHVALIKRKGNKTLPEDASKDFKILSSLEEISFDSTSQKRKNAEESAPQEEQPPAKLPKKDDTSEKIVKEKSVEVKEHAGKDKEEHMEVDSSTPETKDVKEAKKEELKENGENTSEISKTPKPSETETEAVEETKETVKDTPMETDDKPTDEKKAESGETVAEKPVAEAVVNSETKKDNVDKVDAKAVVETSIEGKVNADSIPKDKKTETKKEAQKDAPAEAEMKPVKEKTAKKEETEKVEDKVVEGNVKVSKKDAKEQAEEKGKETTVEEKSKETKVEVVKETPIEETVTEVEEKQKETKMGEKDVKVDNKEKHEILVKVGDKQVKVEGKANEESNDKASSADQTDDSEVFTKHTQTEPAVSKESQTEVDNKPKSIQTEKEEKPETNGEEKKEKEKENISELANGVANEKETSNGNADEEMKKQNGDVQERNESCTSKTEDVKTKKLDESKKIEETKTDTSTPPVRVEV